MATGSTIGKVGQKLSQIASDIPTIRTGTVITNLAQLDQTLVQLDNDPSGNPVNANGLTSPLPAGARVACLTIPPRGLLILGVLVEIPAAAPVPPLIAGASIFAYGGNSTFTSTNGAPYRSLQIECWAGGGAGGGAPTTTAGNSSGGGGGGGGGYARHIIPVTSINYPLQINVGGGGSGVSGAAGGGGGNTSVVDNNGAGGIFVRALGGGGGQVLANGAVIPQQSAGAAGGSGDVGAFAQSGGQGFRSNRVTATQVFQGAGGQGAMGGQGGLEAGAGGANGSSGVTYGGGGAGAHASNGNGPFTGGAGAQGLVVITGLP